MHVQRVWCKLNIYALCERNPRPAPRIISSKAYLCCCSASDQGVVGRVEARVLCLIGLPLLARVEVRVLG